MKAIKVSARAAMCVPTSYTRKQRFSPKQLRKYTLHWHKTSKLYGRPAAGLLFAAPFLLFSPQSSYEEENKENQLSEQIPSFAPPSAPSSPFEQQEVQEEPDSPSPVDCDIRFCVGISVIPHPAKRAKGGEDAYFVSDDMRCVGIADGVGGWGDIGVDPALYSRTLCEGCKLSADAALSDRDPVDVMSDGYEFASSIRGSSTCCVICIEGNKVRAANLGDSGFLVIRGKEIIYKAQAQQHSFNFPYQLGTGSLDRPEHADQCVIDVQTGDLIVVGTDGLFDNLFDEEIAEITTKATEPVTLAQLIARQAHIVANSRTHLSPFASDARGNGYPLCVGGKLDDITVLVARVVLDCDASMAA